MKGLIALLGSGEYLPVMNDVDRHLLASVAVDGRNPQVVCLPTAAGEEGDESVGRWLRMGKEHFETLGATVHPLRIISRSSADDPQYEPIIQMNGAAFYLVNGNGGVKIEANARYTACPPLVRLGDLRGSPFAPPREDAPLWTSYVNEPEVYAMLSDPAEAQRRFKPQSINKTD